MLIYGEHEKEIGGYAPHTTNNRMEIMAVIEALKMLKEPCQVSLYTDSAYVCNAMRQGWLSNWLKNGWKTANKKPVENQDLWQEIADLTKTHEVTFFKVKGHADNPYNNRCDEIARRQIQTGEKK